jgi:hypothetical protein
MANYGTHDDTAVGDSGNDQQCHESGTRKRGVEDQR